MHHLLGETMLNQPCHPQLFTDAGKSVASISPMDLQFPQGKGRWFGKFGYCSSFSSITGPSSLLIMLPGAACLVASASTPLVVNSLS